MLKPAVDRPAQPSLDPPSLHVVREQLRDQCLEVGFGIVSYSGATAFMRACLSWEDRLQTGHGLLARVLVASEVACPHMRIAFSPRRPWRAGGRQPLKVGRAARDRRRLLVPLGGDPSLVLLLAKVYTKKPRYAGKCQSSGFALKPLWSTRRPRPGARRR